MTKLSSKSPSVEAGAPVTITMGAMTLQGSVRAIGEAMPMPMPGELAEAHFRQVVVDLDGDSPPLELWLADGGERR